jgi:hypothetical protein
MGTLSTAVDGEGGVTVSGGPVQVRCFGWVDVDQDNALIFDGSAQRVASERGHRFEGCAELEAMRVAYIERFGGWTALILPHGSRLLVEGEVALPQHNQPAVGVNQALQQPAPPVPGQETARKVVGVVLALVLLDLFSR